MIRINKKFETIKNLNCKILLQIHDELIFEVKKDEVLEYEKLIKKEMSSVKDSDLHTFQYLFQLTLIMVIIGVNTLSKTIYCPN